MQAADMMGLQFDRPTGGSARTNRLRTPGLSSVRTGNGQATSTSTATLMSLLPEDAEGDVGISDERGVPSSEDLQRMTLVGPSSGSQWNSEAVAAGAAAQLLSGIEAVSRFGGAIGKVTSVARISNLALFGAGKKSTTPTFDLERPSVLGKAFTKKAKTSYNARKQWRDTTTCSSLGLALYHFIFYCHA